MADNYLPTQYQQYIHLSRYSRWDYDKNRRETWKETVDRYFDFFRKHLEENCNYTVDRGLETRLKKSGILNSLDFLSKVSISLIELFVRL